MCNKYLFFILSLLLVTSCTHRLTYHNFSQPIFYANQQRSGVNPSQIVLKSGLLIAIWPDGRILKAESPTTVGLTYYYGKLNNQDLKIVISQIQALYKNDIESPGVPVDLASRDIYIYPQDVDAPVGSNYFYSPDYEKKFQPANILDNFMKMEIEEGVKLSWDQLPRFGPPVFGKW